MNEAAAAGWTKTTVGQVLTLEYGRSLPEKKRESGPYAVYGSNGEIGRARQYFLEDKTIIVGRKGSAGEITLGEPKSWPIDTTYYVRVRDTGAYSLDFLYYLLKWLDPRRFVETTTKPGLNRDRVHQQVVTVPPLPVQERIVQILQKADEIRRKRQEALETANAILPSIFKDVFLRSSRYPKSTIGDLREIKGGKRLPKGSHYSHAPTRYRYLRVTDLVNGRVNIQGMMFLSEETQRGIARYTTSPGDVVISIAGEAGITALIPNYGSEQWNLTENMAVLRCRRELGTRILPSYLLWFLRSERGQEQIKQRSAASTIQKLALFRLASVEVPVPPLNIQEAFERECGQAEEMIGRLEMGRREASETYGCLFDQAFTGELTAEWEAANADWIATQVKLQERLPRLLLLALIRGKAARAGRAVARADILVTALMKYTFLFQMEGNDRRRFYQFVPYHYGPFAKEVYVNLERLQADGLVTVDEDAEEDKTRIALADPSKADAALADLPEDLKADVSSILDAYGDLDHNALLRTVYDRYPAYAKASRARIS